MPTFHTYGYKYNMEMSINTISSIILLIHIVLLIE